MRLALPTALLLLPTLALAQGAPAATPAASPAPAAGGAAGALSFLQGKTADLKALMGHAATGERKIRVRALAESVVDYADLAKRSLKGEWDKRNEAEQGEFKGLLKSLIERSYLEQVEKKPDFEVKWEDHLLNSRGDMAKVRTLASSGETAIELEYRLSLREGGSWIAHDIAIDGVSMVKNYRRSFRREIRKGGWAGLIRKMRKKLDEG